jgi:hypothetical protein
MVTNRRTWEEYTGEKRAIQDGDFVILEIEGIDQEGNIVIPSGTHYDCNCGADLLSAEIQEAVIGKTEGDEIQLNINGIDLKIDILLLRGTYQIPDISTQEGREIYENCEDIIWNAALQQLYSTLQENNAEYVIASSEEQVEEEFYNVKEFYAEYARNHSISEQIFVEDYLGIDMEQYDSVLRKMAEEKIYREKIEQLLEEYRIVS